ncbi:EAL domain-containing protein [Kineosporia succinea]|uniref:EAL domain-containing protein (Putative c-di-GMP-specific phosphodiesterase class I) n=1 Tax=Kineosporia succinea TaxID=84632 RepID=A0ABT9NXI2_9ACTN|nr:EAL domain-containing protein [Kineosporia succinea]MDP9825138.1 EAL domain-containing protein (putative c-di-GMP-specific phosphodiesterase class I) [Kineosporia succinea]
MPSFPRPRVSAEDLEIRRLLRLARVHLGLELAAVVEVLGDEVALRAVDCGQTSLTFLLDRRTPLEGSYTQGILSGKLPAHLTDTHWHPASRDLAGTRENGIGSYAAVPVGNGALLICASGVATPELDERATQFLGLLAEMMTDQLRRAHIGDPARIHEALDPSRFRMVYQPIVDLSHGGVVGYEALARFDDPGFPTPAHAFEAATRAGVGVQLELLTMRSALEQLPAVPAGGRLNVNLSAEALMTPAVVELILHHAEYPLSVEITEHTQVRDYNLLAQPLALLRGAGVEIVVDDAGAGFANFVHLLKLRPSVIKLDIEIVRGVDLDPMRLALTRSLVGFAAEAKVSLVAEGIETAGELQTLREIGVGFGQGFICGRPAALPAA